MIKLNQDTSHRKTSERIRAVLVQMWKRSQILLVVMAVFAGLTGCKSREAQFLIENPQSEKIQEEGSQDEEAQGKKDQGNGQTQGSKDTGQETEASTNIEETLSPEPEKIWIYVDVCGAVANPGVFQLEEGSRVFQAIEAAGGYLEDAAQNCVNRASILSDGQQLYILTQEEMQQQGIDPAQAALQGQNTAGGQAAADSQGQQDDRVNINTADESQLTTLTGIGSTRAQAIIAYREANGPFAAIEEIMNVQGIKEGTFTKIKDDIVVE